MVNVLWWGIGGNIVLLIAYAIFHHQINKFEKVRERILIAVRRSRAAYLHVYLLVIIIAGIIGYFIPQFAFHAIFVGIGLLIIIDMQHDAMRVVLTDNALISIKGFFNTKVKTVEYKDIVVVEVGESIIGQVLHFGEVKVNIGGSGKEFSFKKIPRYIEIKNIIERRKMMQERGYKQRRYY